MLLAIAAVTMASTSPVLLEHLVSQGAPRAAARLRGAEALASTSPSILTVAPSAITLVEDGEGAVRFIEAVRGLPAGSTIAIDAEWRPDHRGERQLGRHKPSILQLATAGEVWLVDLDCSDVLDRASAAGPSKLLSAISDVLASETVRVLGFSIQHDLDKLQLLYSPEHGFSSGYRLTARRVVDLRGESACGLSSLLARYAGRKLDKSCQTSDWQRRPLSAQQVQYAAADAACLHVLDEALGAAAAATGTDGRVWHEELIATAASSRGASDVSVEADAAAAADTAARYADALRAVRAAAATVSDRLGDSARLVACDDATSGDAALDSLLCDRLEVNALCLTSPAGPLLVLLPAEERLDTRWLALVLNLPRRKVKLASVDECSDTFGATAGLVPPLPLHASVRVLCHPQLVAHEEIGLWASAGHPDYRLLIDSPRRTLPALVEMHDTTGTRTLDGTGEATLPFFSFLPDPSLWHGSLEEALEGIHAMRPDGPVFSSPEEEVEEAEEDDSSSSDSTSLPNVRLMVDSSLSVLARKLRMVGIDTVVAGEVIKHQEPGCMISPAVAASEAAAAGEAAKAAGDVNGGATGGRIRRQVGLLRVGIETSLIEGQLRRGALEGRLLVTSGSQKAVSQLPGAAYRLVGADAGAQFAELLAVLGLSDAVDAGGSRCGICNGDDWHTLRPHEVGAGQVPPAVLAKQSIFYRCGACQQMFWPGDKYESTIEQLRAEGRDELTPTMPEPPRAGTAGGIWRPPSGTVDGAAAARPGVAVAATASIGQQVRQAGSLHSTQRMQLSVQKGT